MSFSWRYVIPNAITCISITAALLSISEAIAGRFDAAAWVCLICVLLDKADGTAARLLKSSSRFGIQMDSLSDLIAFGVAPAVLILSFLGGPASPSHLAADPLYRILLYSGCFLYVIAAALRLAKFNVLTETYSGGFFFGLPTTFCGGVMCCLFLVARKYQLPLICFEALPGVLLVMALLMVSRIPLPKVGRQRSRVMTIVAVVSISLAYIFVLLRVFPEYLLALSAGYTLLGSIWAVSKGIKPGVTPPESTSVGQEGEEEALGDQL